MGDCIDGLHLLMFGTQQNTVTRRKMEEFSNEICTSNVMILDCRISFSVNSMVSVSKSFLKKDSLYVTKKPNDFPLNYFHIALK